MRFRLAKKIFTGQAAHDYGGGPRPARRNAQRDIKPRHFFRYLAQLDRQGARARTATLAWGRQPNLLENPANVQRLFDTCREHGVPATVFMAPEVMRQLLVEELQAVRL